MEPDILCARVLKARYFPNCSILEVEASGDMSYTWRSVLKGVDLLKKGIMWRIDTGGNVCIWEDPWISRGDIRRPHTWHGSILINRVSDLTNPITETWDVELMTELFCEEDAKEILVIPVRSDMDDLVA